MDNSFIKLYRAMLEWEWYSDSKMVHLYIHLLLKANFSDGRFHGKEVKRGQLITGRNALSKDTGISTQSIRTCLERLKSTNEITIQSTNDFSLITIVKYDVYQSFDKSSTSKSTSKLTNDQPASNQQVTTIEEEEEEEEEKDIIFNFKSSLLSYGFKENLISEWLKVRKNKKATNTETAFNKFIIQVELTKKDKNKVLEICIERSWSGFNAEWIKSELDVKKQTTAPDYAKFISGE